MGKTEKMKEVRDKVIQLTKSPLYEYRVKNKYHAVLGEGSHNADIFFIGEAPGKNEAIEGRPFCGRAGKILDELLLGIELDRKNVYITNIVKDRPPENRDPTPDEIDLYGPFLIRQINIVMPHVLVPLGRFSSAYILEKFGHTEKIEPISVMHGRKYETNFSYGSGIIVPMYHPAVAIYNNDSMNELKKDFIKLKKYVHEFSK